MAHEHVPQVSQELIKHLRSDRREWQNTVPEKDWDMHQIQRAIGANEVILYLEELLARQMGVLTDYD